MGRLFNLQQKQALYWLSEGKCTKCGTPLPEDWHADHVVPYTEGGRTDVTNGQALCPKCNLEKGSKSMLKPWPSTVVLRSWQEQFLNQYRTEEKRDFLLVATPGAGKTTASLRAKYDLLRSGEGQRIVVVCPSDHLRTQWLYAASDIGIPLDRIVKGWNNEIAQSPDYLGLVTTYAEVLSNTEQLLVYTSRYKTLVILDEIHHCGESEHLMWGAAIRKAFSPAVRRLLLSGTPFRTDNHKIPFVKYEPDPAKPNGSRSKSDYNYGYGDVLKDEEVVRHIIFPGWDGEFAWSDWFGEERKENFQSLLNKPDSSARLKTAINASGEAMRTVLTKANQKLEEIRRDGHINAGGLVVAQDQSAAKILAKVLEEISGEKPILAISEIGDEASPEIKKFSEGRQKWIVAVKMISEGVDIKRLRVGVYATNILTETFFRQVIGRVIRWDRQWNHLDDQTAWFYVPEDPQLLRLARTIKEEVDHYIEEREESDKQKSAEAGASPPMQISMGDYEFRYSEGDEVNHHTSGETFPMDELALANSAFASTPGFERIPDATKALFLRNLGAPGQVQADISPTHQAISVQPEYIRKEALKKKLKTKIGRLVFMCQENGISVPDGNLYKAINNAWGRSRSYNHTSTNDELQSKLDWIESLIRACYALF
ncbi:MAG: DEAD/DEAH box helicase family protein [Janthinobacterium lividum]